MDVVVTGSAGFIGGALVERLRTAGHTVRGLDLSGQDIAGDVSVAGAWQREFEGAQVVIHTAALVGMPSDTARFWQVNTLGTRNVVDAAVRSGCSRVVLLSSVTVFGNDFPHWVTEEHPTRPTGVPYADTKIAAEHLCLDAHIGSGIETVIVRPGDVYGPGSRPWTILPVNMIKSRRVAVPTRGVHSPVYIDDVVAGVVAAATTPGAAGRIYTLSGGTGVPTGEFFDHYARMLGRRSVPRLPRSTMLAAAAVQAGAGRRLGRTIELSPDAVRYLSDRSGTYSIERARAELGWEPSVDLDEGMARTQRWLWEQGMV